MFESMLAKAAQCSEKNDWISVLPGVKACDFDRAFPAEHPPYLPPGHFEALFCQGGALRIYTASGRSRCIQKGDILLVSDVSQIRSVSFSAGRFQGTVVAVNAAEAEEGLARIGSLLTLAEPDGEQVERQMRAAGGCACIHGEAWSDALFIALAELPAEERGRYCALKTAELLYLLCRGGLALSRMWLEQEGGQGELVRQVGGYIQAHLAENLSIDRLAKQFHCSPTTLKAAFRQSYGIPIHRCISAYRLRRGAELLHTTTFSVLQVASEVGYSSTSQFSAMFKRRYHLSPAQYRRRREKSETGDFPV